MTTSVETINAAKPTANSATPQRLPCRGCTPECRNYDRCDGKPWRMGS